MFRRFCLHRIPNIYIIYFQRNLFSKGKTTNATPMINDVTFRKDFIKFSSVCQTNVCNSSTFPATWTCENCGKVNMKYILMCSKCQFIIDTAQLKLYTHFDLLDQEKTFDLDLAKMSKHFRRLQSHLHPDKFAMKDKMEQECAQHVSSKVNAAYQTLLKPAKRAAYLLELNGKPFEEKSVQMDNDFLADIMETNESLSTCGTMEKAKKLKAENDEKLDELYQHISKCFRQTDYDAAMLCLGKLNYFENINEKLKDLLMKLS